MSYFSGRDPRHVRADLVDMLDHGCTYVVHCLTETDLAFNLAGMGDIIRWTRDAGMEPWADPWGACGIFSGETFSRFLLDHPESWQVLSDGRAVPAACPRDPSARQFLRRWTRTAAELGVRVAFWDEPHFWADPAAPDERWACMCALCRDAFRDRFRTPMPAAFTEEVRQFRDETLLELLTDLCREAHRAGLRTALCLPPSDLAAHGFVDAERRMVATLDRRRAVAGLPPLETVPPSLRYFGPGDWGAAAAIPDLDIFGTAPYWFLFEAHPEPFVETFTLKALRVARAASERYRRPRAVQIWMQAFGVPGGRERELFGGVRLAARLGATHVAAWSYGGNTAMSYNRPANPAAVWDVLGNAFRSVR